MINIKQLCLIKGQLAMALLRMQCLVDAAGEALGILEDPLLSEIGMKVTTIEIIESNPQLL